MVTPNPEGLFDMKMRFAVVIILCLFAGGLLLSCHKGGGSVFKQVFNEVEAPLAKNKAASGQARAAELPDTSKIQRRIILNGDISITVKSVDDAVKKIRSLQDKAGGYMTSMSVEDVGSGVKQGEITIRVPQRRFENVLEQVRKLGKVEEENVSGEDVTDEYVDLESRLRNMERQEARYLEVLDKAGSISDILRVEEQLNRIRGDIEVLTGRLNQLQNKTDFATLTISLSERAPVAKPDAWSFRSTLGNAVRAFLSTVNVIIRVGIWLGVFLPFLIVIYLLIRWIRRRR